MYNAAPGVQNGNPTGVIFPRPPWQSNPDQNPVAMQPWRDPGCGQNNQRVVDSGRFSLVLSGRNTLCTLYRLLSAQFQDQIPGRKVQGFLGIERTG
ncbi:MAG TPA: hypothetical protein VJP02_08210 [Candidatus Sulfotelmatobacter sp.]|nr:hypothetical protein [Candidatus Sulfotelmatobacter sp.]